MTTMNLYDMTDTWNAGATTFTAVKMDVTDTASASGSLLLDLQVGGSSKFNVTKDGELNVLGNLIRFGSGGEGYLRVMSTTVTRCIPGSYWNFGGVSVALGADAFIPDIFLARDAANTLAQRNGTNAQAFRIYGTYTDASNWERLSVGYAAESLGNQFVVAHAKAGSGTNRNLWIGTLGSTSTIIGTNGTGRWTFNENGHFVANADNAYDIGADGANRPRNLFVATAIYAPSWYGGTTSTSAGIISGANVLTLQTYAAGTFERLQFGGTTSSFPALKRNSTALDCVLADDSGFANFQCGALTANGNLVIGTSSLIRFGGGGGRSDLASPSDGVITLRNNANSDFSRLQFGGTTSSFPALKRVGANLQTVAADDTATAGFIVGNQALATNATDGFLYVPTCAGAPTGTPTARTGTAPIIVDTTNNKLYFYSGGQWRDAGP
jgi:hypothetical protein